MTMLHNDFTSNYIRRQEFLETVAASIEVKLGLSQGRALVGLIGDGYGRSNHDALVSWIARNWEWDADPDARTATSRLSDSLEDLLRQFD